MTGPLLNPTDWALLVVICSLGAVILMAAVFVEMYNNVHSWGRRWRRDALLYRAERDALARRLRTRPRPLQARPYRPSFPVTGRPADPDPRVSVHEASTLVVDVIAPWHAPITIDADTRELAAVDG